jgi:hypothetical protein
VRIIVEEMFKDENAVGITQESVKAAVSLQMRANRVPISSDADPYLYININAVGTGTPYAVGVDIKLKQAAKLETSGMRRYVATWSRGSTLRVGSNAAKAFILESLKEDVDVFCSDYLTANEDAVATTADNGAKQLAFP